MSENPALQGTWMVISYRSGDLMVGPDHRTEASLTIDGTLIAGSMGLNRFTGQLEDGVAMGPLATTQMAGPPELMQQEEILLGHLQDADTFEVIDDGMNLSSDGFLLVELEKSGTDDPVPTS